MVWWTAVELSWWRIGSCGSYSHFCFGWKSAAPPLTRKSLRIKFSRTQIILRQTFLKVSHWFWWDKLVNICNILKQAIFCFWNWDVLRNIAAMSASIQQIRLCARKWYTYPRKTWERKQEQYKIGQPNVSFKIFISADGILGWTDSPSFLEWCP